MTAALHARSRRGVWPAAFGALTGLSWPPCSSALCSPGSLPPVRGGLA